MNKQQQITQIAAEIYAANIVYAGSRGFYWKHGRDNAREAIHAAQDIVGLSIVNLTWLPTELGTNYSSGGEFFITNEPDGYWLWLTATQVRLGLFSTDTAAMKYAEHLRTR
jgi:hypothetical protein